MAFGLKPMAVSLLCGNFGCSSNSVMAECLTNVPVLLVLCYQRVPFCFQQGIISCLRSPICCSEKLVGTRARFSCLS